MCLVINSAAKVAEEDIICYKVLEECKLEGYPYMSPFQENLITSEIVCGLWPYVGLGDRTIKQDNCGQPIVSEGYIHTYKFKTVAEDMCQYLTKHFENDCHLFECKIPAGTEYYEGFDTNFLSSYASERIVFEKLF